PEVEVPDLRPLDADDAKEMAGGRMKAARLPRRHDRFGNFLRLGARLAVEFRVELREAFARVDPHRRGGATRLRIRRWRRLGRGPHGDDPFFELGRRAHSSTPSLTALSARRQRRFASWRGWQAERLHG